MKHFLALLAAVAVSCSAAQSATFYVQTTGAANNSGSTDQDAANLTGSAATHSTTTVTLDGSPNLSTLITTAGATQSTIYLDGSTVANRKIFKITAFDNAAKTVTVDADPTCAAGACGTWAIGGRILWPSGSTVWHSEASVAAGDVLQFNDTPASRTAAFFTFRTGGTTTEGYVKVRGKSGVRPVLNITNTANVISWSGTTPFTWLENLELDQDGASGDCLLTPTVATTLWNIKIVDCGGSGVNTAGAINIWHSEISGAGIDGISWNQLSPRYVYASYIHDNGRDGIRFSAAGGCMFEISNSIIASNAGRGLYCTGTSVTSSSAFLSGSVIYGNGDDGIAISDVDQYVHITNSIIAENGNAAGEYNIDMISGSQLFAVQKNNIIWHTACQGAGASTCVNNYTLQSTEIGASPQFVNAAGGDFALQSTSPGASAGYPTGVGAPGAFIDPSYPDIGAIQRQVTSGGGGGSSSIAVRPGLQ